MLEKGLMWQVGNEQHIKIWKDPWLPNGTHNKVPSSPSFLPKESTGRKHVGVRTSYKSALTREL